MRELSGVQRQTSPNFFLHKYANMNTPAVCQGLADNHHRHIAHSYLQDVSDWVGGIAQVKEELWEYAAPPLAEAITTLVVSLDGAYV
ncbi:MAG: hypothetical protein Q7U57_15370 [Methylovulum sp.]|nr:hypothetical protein [Methylovulum sp.]